MVLGRMDRVGKEVILLLNKQGLQVVAAPLPLTSLSDDIVALNRTIARTNGPVIVAGHAYAGAVIAAANDERVKALVYVAALAPEEGETVAQVFYRDEAHPQAPKLAPDKDGWIWMPEEGFSNAFAHHATGDQIAVSKAVQRPIALKCIQEPAPKPAWRSKPSWFLIAERRPYDQSQNTTFHGKSNAGSYSYICRRPYTFAHRAGKGPAGHHCRCARNIVIVETIIITC